MKIEDFGEPQDSGYVFGLSKSRAVAALRNFADHLEREDCVLAKVDIHSAVKHDDFATHTLTITFAEKQSG